MMQAPLRIIATSEATGRGSALGAQYWQSRMQCHVRYLWSTRPVLARSATAGGRRLLAPVQRSLVPVFSMTVIVTKRTHLRELTTDDAEFILDLLNQPTFLRFIGDRQVRTRAEAAAFIETRYRKSYADHGYGLWAVVQTTSDTPIGICGFVRREGLEHADIGVAFLPQFAGHGYAAEVTAGTLAHGRTALGMTTVLAIVQSDNTRSIRLLTALGFVFSRSVTLPSAPDDTLELLTARL
jgi:[ribosomal protein S5]-alanine N-acetyltransferase